VSKGRLLEVVTEAVDINAAAPLAALKKDAAVAGAEQAMAGAGWLPMCLRTGASSKPPGDEGGTGTGKVVSTDEAVELAV
jgi:ParB family chromosome partitioning protein